MHKREDGFVVVDEDICIGCRYCHMACPYGAPQFNAEKGHMTKCDGCYSRVAEGHKPICVESCPLRALDFGPLKSCAKNTVSWRLSPRSRRRTSRSRAL
jgi:anaerobic dimethyl sulfoxide reductase subunit B (iron-sulfur subunit)